MRSAKIMTTGLRSFLSYVRYRGDITSDLAAAVPIVANWSHSSIPRAIGRDAVTRLLASIDRDTSIGCRDYAMTSDRLAIKALTTCNSAMVELPSRQSIRQQSARHEASTTAPRGGGCYIRPELSGEIFSRVRMSPGSIMYIGSANE
jgi:hypothetical protein